MKLRLLARENAVAFVPGAPRAVNQPPHYIGRRHVVENGVGKFPATEEGTVVDLDQTSPEFWRYQKLVSRGDVWAGNAETAAALGVAFVSVLFRDGAWVRSAAAIATARKEQR